MPGHDTLKRDGGWSVELINPIDQIGVVDLRSPTLDIATRWSRGEFASSMALCSALTSLPESTLGLLTYPDVDRVLLALFNIVPQNIKDDLQAGRFPILSQGSDAVSSGQPDELPPEPAKPPPAWPWPESATGTKEWPRTEPPKNNSGDKSDGALSAAPPDIMRPRV